MAIVQLVRHYQAEMPPFLAEQVLRVGTEIGVHLAEAGAAHSRRMTLSQMTFARKACLEIGYWLKLLLASEILPQTEATPFLEEAHSLHTDLTAACVKVRSQLEAEKT